MFRLFEAEKKEKSQNNSFSMHNKYKIQFNLIRHIVRIPSFAYAYNDKSRYKLANEHTRVIHITYYTSYINKFRGIRIRIYIRLPNACVKSKLFI